MFDTLLLGVYLEIQVAEHIRPLCPIPDCIRALTVD